MADEIHYANRMSDTDSLMWAIEKDPLLRSTITTLFILDGPVDRARLRATMDRATRVVPRLRQRVRSNPLSVAPPRWEVDPNFDLDYHVRWSKAPDPGSIRDVFAMAEPAAMQGFDRARPLWEVTVVDGVEGGRSALIMKIHHAITDGVGGIRIMLELFDFEPEGTERGAPPKAPDVQVLNQAGRFVDAAAHETRRQIGALRRRVAGALGGAADPSGTLRSTGDAVASVARFVRPASEPLSPLMVDRSLSQHFDSLSFPLEDLKGAARAAGGRLNDAFVAAVAGGFRRYHLRHDRPVDALRMAMPISVRSEESDGESGNYFVPTRMEIPIAIVDPVERMQQIKKIVAATRDEPYLSLNDRLAAVINRFPTTLTTGLFGSLLRTVDFTTSNVPGSPIDVYVGGARLEQHLAFGPIAGASANITLLSYGPEVHIGFNLDPAAIPDTRGLLRDMESGFDEVLSGHSA